MNGQNDTSHVNGNSKVLWWLIGGIITPLIITTFNNVAGDSKRVTTLETTIQDIDRRLERLENKLEKLLERNR